MASRLSISWPLPFSLASSPTASPPLPCPSRSVCLFPPSLFWQEVPQGKQRRFHKPQAHIPPAEPTSPTEGELPFPGNCSKTPRLESQGATRSQNPSRQPRGWKTRIGWAWIPCPPLESRVTDSNGAVASHEEITVSDKGRETAFHITLRLIMQNPYNLVVTWKEA